MHVFRLHTFPAENGSLICYDTCLIVAGSPKASPHKTLQSGLLIPELILLHIVPWAVFKTEFGSILLSFNLECLIPFLCWTCLHSFHKYTGHQGKVGNTHSRDLLEERVEDDN